MRSRSRITPAIGGYWLRPELMYFVTRSRSSFAQSKSGKPCDRLIALCSCASRDITVKIVVPTLGSLDAMGRGKEGMAAYSSNHPGAPRHPSLKRRGKICPLLVEGVPARRAACALYCPGAVNRET